MIQVAFFVGAIGALGGAIAVVALRNPFYSVLALVVHLVSLAGLFLLLHAQFVAAAQVVVYAGAVMVLYVFVAAYVGQHEEPLYEPIAGQRVLAPLLGVALFIELSIAVLGTALSSLDSPRAERSRDSLRRAGVDRQPPPRALPRRLRGGVDAAAGRRGRRGRPGGPPRRGAAADSDAPEAALMDVSWYLVLSRAAVRHRGVRRAAAAKPAGDPALPRADAERGQPRAGGVLARDGNEEGQIFALIVMVVAACEVVVGLGLIVAMFRRRLPLDIDDLRSLRG